METHTEGLGELLRAWRDRLSPDNAGIVASSNRRALGLRREELAALAGLSVDYVIRLEQGRAQNPSAQVVSALARALHLNSFERDHLYRSARLLPPAAERVSTQIPLSVQRLVARLGDNPLAVFAADWSLLSWNALWSALQGDPIAIPIAQRNLARAVFSDRGTQRYLRPSVSVNGSDHFEAAIVADLRTAKTAYPSDPDLRALLRELRHSSPTFGKHWQRAEVGRHTTDRKTIIHPDVGEITLDCDVLTVPGSDLRLIVYSAPQASADAGKLDFLRVASRATLIPFVEH